MFLALMEADFLDSGTAFACVGTFGMGWNDSIHQFCHWTSRTDNISRSLSSSWKIFSRSMENNVIMMRPQSGGKQSGGDLMIAGAVSFER